MGKIVLTKDTSLYGFSPSLSPGLKTNLNIKKELIPIIQKIVLIVWEETIKSFEKAHELETVEKNDM